MPIDGNSPVLNILQGITSRFTQNTQGRMNREEQIISLKVDLYAFNYSFKKFRTALTISSLKLR